MNRSLATVAFVAVCIGALLLAGAPALLLIAFGFALAVLDTAFGMGYGTLATPMLLIAGFHPLAIVPAVLLSQGVAAGVATVFHLRYKNVDLLDLRGNDLRVSAAIIGFGVAGVSAAVVLAITLPSLYVKAYIGLLVTAMGLLLFATPRVRFTWPRVFALSILNGFDKAISGGGFGPVAVGGLVSFGQSIRNSVGIAVFTVTVVNFSGVSLYLLSNALGATEAYLMATLSVGGVLGAAVGPAFTSQLNAEAHLKGLALVMVLVGVLSLLTTLAKQQSAVAAPLLSLTFNLGVDGLIYSFFLSFFAAWAIGTFLADRYMEARLDHKANAGILFASLAAFFVAYLLLSSPNSNVVTLVAEFVVFILVYLTLAPPLGAVKRDDLEIMRHSFSGLGS